MRFWTSLICLLLLRLLEGEAPPLTDCPTYKAACINFLETTDCTVNGVPVPVSGGHQAVLWDMSITKCTVKDWKAVTAQIEFEIHTPYTWSIMIARWENAEDVKFSFANATLKMKDDMNIEFSWNGKDQKKNLIVAGSDTVHVTDWGRYNRKRYWFNVTADGEKLINLFGGPGFTYNGNKFTITFEDPRFLELLWDHTGCNISETKMLNGEECYGACDEIKYEGAFHPLECDSKLWFQTPTEGELMRTWQGVDNITCHMGRWEAKWNGGPQVLGATHEVQCSSEEPAKMTNKMALVLGLGITALILLFIAVIVGVGVCAFKRRRAAIDSHSKAGTFSASVAATPKNNSIH